MGICLVHASRLKVCAAIKTLSGTNNGLGCETSYLSKIRCWDGTSSLLHDGFNNNKRTIYTKIRLVEQVYVFSQAWRTLCGGTSL